MYLRGLRLKFKKITANQVSDSDSDKHDPERFRAFSNVFRTFPNVFRRFAPMVDRRRMSPIFVKGSILEVSNDQNSILNKMAHILAFLLFEIFKIYLDFIM